MPVINHQSSDGLDSYISAIAGDDPSYVNQWPRIEWQAAYNAYSAFSGGPDSYQLAPFLGMPEWLRSMVDGRATPDTDTPAPVMCRLWAETLDWFQIVADHSTDVEIWIDLPLDGHQVTVEQLQAAHAAVRRAGGTPVMTARLDPLIRSEDVRTVVTIESFYVVDNDGTTSAAVAETIFGWPSSKPYFFSEPAHLLEAAGLTAGVVSAWEWMGL